MSSRVRVLVPLWLALPLAAQAGSPPLFVEVAGAPTRVYVQQPVELTVRIGVDRAWFDAHGVALFAQRLDQPFHVDVPWLAGDDAHAAAVVPTPPGQPAQRIAVGDEVLALRTAAQQRRGETTFDVLELRVRWLPLAAGSASLAPVRVRYAFAARFEDDWLRGRQPVDRQEAAVAAAALAIEVQPLPAGAPPGFTGATGEFALRASTSVREVAVGKPFVLALEVLGEGNLERFAVPAPPRLAGFHVQGIVDRPQPGVRRFELDVVALRAGLAEVPPVPFVAFSPGRGTFVTLASAPVPLAVRAAPGELPARVRELVAADAAEVAAANAPSRWWVVAAAVAAALAVALVRSNRRASRRSLAVADAAAAFAAVPAGDAAARLAAFEALLAVAIGATAWPAAGFAQLAARGVPDRVVEQLRELHEALDGARFGGAPPAAAAGDACFDALRTRRP